MRIEQSINREIQDKLQEIWDKHGIRVNYLNVEWIDVSTTSKKDFMIESLGLDTTGFKNSK